MTSGPLILVGSGRCGSTILHKILSHHPHLAWPTRTLNRDTDKMGYNRRVMDALDWPIVGDLVWRREQAGEVYPFWNRHFRGFSTPYRDLLAEDVDERTRTALRQSFAAMTTPSRPTVMMKITGYPRIHFLREVFPDARFVHLVRDGRAAALSDLATPWCEVWKGPGNWSWGPLDADQMETWQQSGESFHVLSALLWEKLMRLYQDFAAELDASAYLELRYEDLCANPHETMGQILDFAGLDWTPKFRRTFDGYALRTTNDKWRKQVTKSQIDLMTAAIAGTLDHYGYDR